MALAHPELAELKRFTFFVSRRFEEGRERFRLHMGYFTTQAEAEEWLAVVREIYPGAWAGEAPGKKLRARAAAAAAEQAQHAVGPMPRPPLPNASAAPQAAPVARAAAPAPARPTQQHAPAPVAVTERLARESPVGVPVARPAVATTFDSPAGAVPTVHAAAAPTLAPPVVSPPVLTPPVAKAAPVQPFVAASKSAPAPHANVPVAKAAPVAPVLSARAPNVGTQVRPAPVLAVPPTAPKAAPVAPLSAGAHARAPVAASASNSAKSAPTAPAQAFKQRPGQKPSASKGNAFSDSNVREVLAALDDSGEATGQTRMMPAPPQLPHVDGSYEPSLTDTQVLRYLETRREGGNGADGDQQEASISLLKPDDTGTRRALKDAVTQNAPVSFAVQLQWSVQPVELDKVPPLAIFSAYTLYTVEGSRDGRKWYGLRLGFFSDAISAKQVAYYVRSEFASVAVVPVSPQEKSRASEEDSKKAASSLPFPRKQRQAPVEEFKLIDSDEPKSAAASASAKAAPKPAAVAARTAPPAAASLKRAPAAKSGGAGRIGARERRGPQTLEETLEILGAGELEVDSARESVNEAGVRHLRVEVQKNTPFSRLLERLSERTKKN